jgi:DNA-binding transcriptional ArsR family regulator
MQKISCTVLDLLAVSANVRRVVADARRWKAMSHPLRREMLRYLARHEAATATTIAAALGENTGATSYHLRVLADAGVIEEIPERAHGRERWWRSVPADLREPDYGSLTPADRAALDAWRAGQIPAELDLVNRFVRELRQHGSWAKAYRATGYFTVADLDDFFDEYAALVARYRHSAADAPAGARFMQVRMFYIPDEPADAHPAAAGGNGGRGGGQPGTAQHETT